VIWTRKRMVRVHFKKGVSDASVQGILVAQRGGHYVIANASHLEDAGASFNLDGEAWIPRENVLYLQPVGAAQ
jgi:hypothetical protein